MLALGTLVFPGLGVAIYAAFGLVAPVAFVMLLGALSATLVVRSRMPVGLAATGRPEGPDVAPGTRTHARDSMVARFLEPSAVPGTVLLIAAYSSWSVFTVFPSVYAQHVAAPLEVLIAYFPILGLAQVIPQPFVGRLADRLGRPRSLLLGCVVSCAGLAIGLLPGVVPFTVAAVVYAVAQSLVMATVSALTMERAPAHRVGSAMATYSLGYQVATASSSLLWGAIIATAGFPTLFAVALGLQVLTIVLVRVLLGSPAGSTRR
jgi:MFS family permease